MEKQTLILEKMITSLLSEKKYPSLRDILVTMNPSDIAGVFNELEQDRIPLLFRLLPKELAAETFVEMEPEAQELLIRGFSDSELKEVVDELYLDDAVDLVEEMPANVVRRILAQADPDTRKSINELLRYPENSAGSIMTTEYVTLRPAMTVGESILRIRRTGVDKETIYTCYVTNNRTLMGLVTVKDLLLAEDDDTPIREIMETHVISVNTQTDQEEVARMFAKYNFLAMPVVDAENRMVGIVTFDDAMDVMEEEATEDIEIMGGMSPSEKTYSRATVWDLFKQRIPWLLLLMVSATFTGMIITSFETALASPCSWTPAATPAPSPPSPSSAPCPWGSWNSGIFPGWYGRKSAPPCAAARCWPWCASERLCWWTSSSWETTALRRGWPWWSASPCASPCLWPRPWAAPSPWWPRSWASTRR